MKGPASERRRGLESYLRTRHERAGAHCRSRTLQEHTFGRMVDASQRSAVASLLFVAKLCRVDTRLRTCEPRNGCRGIARIRRGTARIIAGGWKSADGGWMEGANTGATPTHGFSIAWGRASRDNSEV